LIPLSVWALPVAFVMVMATAIAYGLNYLVLLPFNIEYMQTVMFILVIASLVQIVELVLKKISKPLYQSLGIFLPLITTNLCHPWCGSSCDSKPVQLFISIVFAFFSAIGFTFAIVIFAGIREKLEEADVPGPFRNVPISLITAAILALAFMGFAGLVK
jgi:electron transport complex protein RnfA